MIDAARVLCRLEELPPGGCREFRLGEGDWPLRGLVLRLTDAELAQVRRHARGLRPDATLEPLRAYVNRCQHMPFPMNYLPDDFFSYDGSLIECKMHGAMYEKDSGLCVRGPCLGRSLIRLALCVEAGCVLLADQLDLAALATRYA